MDEEQKPLTLSRGIASRWTRVPKRLDGRMLRLQSVTKMQGCCGAVGLYAVFYAATSATTGIGSMTAAMVPLTAYSVPDLDLGY
jgi:hypothetical protein